MHINKSIISQLFPHTHPWPQIATGWCITRTHLKSKLAPFLFPLVNFLTSIVVDYIIEANHAYVDEGAEEGGVHRVQANKISSQSLRLVLFVSAFTSLMSLFYAWVWILQNISEEKVALLKRIALATAQVRACVIYCIQAICKSLMPYHVCLVVHARYLCQYLHVTSRLIFILICTKAW